MPVAVKLGRRPAVADARVPFLAAVAPALPDPPALVDWYAGPEETPTGWLPLGNMTVSDCVIAAALHLIQSATCYADAPIEPTEAEAITAYSEATGYDPADPATDAGAVILGPGGFMEWWHKTGPMLGGRRRPITAFVQVGAEHWKAAIHLFGGALFGIDLPENIVAGDDIPYGWDDASGPSAGGHCIYVCGYFESGRQTFYAVVSWGRRFLASEAFLRAVTREAVAVVDPDAIDACGLNADGVGTAALSAAMAALRT